MTAAVWHILVELAPWLFVGALAAGLLHAFMPADFLRRRLQGFWGVVKGAVLGVPMPLCSCAVIPAGLGLRREGASAGATVAFMISTPQTGLDSLLVARAFLGWPFALYSLASSFVLGMIAGWWTDAAGDSPSAPTEVGQPTCAPTPQGAAWRRVLAGATDALRSIWGWLAAGVLASAAIEQFVPAGSLSGLAQNGGLPAMLAALAVGVPLYVCTTASVPLAASLVQAGFPPGAALVFLIAGPATNLATMGAVYRVLGRRTLAIYLATITVGSVLFGLAFDAFYAADSGTTPTVAHDHRGAAWWRLASAAALLALLAWFAWQDAAALLRRRGQRVEAGPGAGTPIEVGVEGMTCGNCVARLERRLVREPGVDRAVVTLEPGRARVVGAVSEPRIRELIAEAGFRAVDA